MQESAQMPEGREFRGQNKGWQASRRKAQSARCGLREPRGALVWRMASNQNNSSATHSLAGGGNRSGGLMLTRRQPVCPGTELVEPHKGCGGTDPYGIPFIVEQRNQDGFESGIVPQRDDVDGGRPHGPV